MRGWREALRAWRRRRRQATKRLRAFREADVVVVSYGKSGRTWLAAMLSHLYHRRYGLPEELLLDGDRLHERDARVPRVLFTHDGPGEPWNRDRAAALRTLAGKKVVFLARDPRDVAVSIYHHTAKRREPEVRAKEGFLPGVPPPALYDYVARPKGKLRGIIGYLNAWAELLPRLPRALRVSYEAMRADPHGTLGRVAAFIDRPFTEEEIAAAVAFAAFDSLQAKERDGFFPNFRLRPGDVSGPAIVQGPARQGRRLPRGLHARAGGGARRAGGGRARPLLRLRRRDGSENSFAIVPLRIESVSAPENRR